MRGSAPGAHRCPLCASAALSVFFEMAEAPVHIGLQWPSAEAARACPKGEIELAFCRECGFIANLAFDPRRLEYAPEYDNTLHFSPLYQEYAYATAERLIRRYGLSGKEILEIGCGRGEFLSLLCALGNNRGVGFDPGCGGGERRAAGGGEVSFVNDFYSERHAGCGGDLVCCRYVLEHVPDPVELLATVRRAIADRREAVVYFEVPNAAFILRDLSVWDIIYEHCSYFSRESLANLFTRCGFEVLELAETYGGQLLAIEARPGHGAVWAEETRGDELAVAAFPALCRKKLGQWQRRLERMERTGRRVALWGAGAKGVSFLNMLPAHGAVHYAVDVNPRKQGKFIAGTGQRIRAPAFLSEDRPDVVIVVNPLYQDEIRRITAGLGVAPLFLCA
jgi:SAM-dependent methyltransferase